VLNFRKPPVCQDALGMESGAIPDGQIGASSEWNSNHAAIQGKTKLQTIRKQARRLVC